MAEVIVPSKIEGIAPETAEIPIPVRAYLGPIILEIPAKPAQVAVVVRMATQELLAAGIISPRVPASDAERAIAAAQAGTVQAPAMQQPQQQAPAMQPQPQPDYDTDDEPEPQPQQPRQRRIQ